jgi:hypothetical protein
MINFHGQHLDSKNDAKDNCVYGNRSANLWISAMHVNIYNW